MNARAARSVTGLVSTLVSGLARDRRGVAALLMALMAVPVIGFVALAIDVGLAVWARERLAVAADAAALVAVMAGANAFAADEFASMVPAQEAGVQRFAAQIGGVPGVSVSPVAVAVSRRGGSIAATVTYNAVYQTHLAALFGVTSIPLGGVVSTSRAITPYFDIEVVMDNSGSMAIPSTLAAMNQLGKLVQASPLYAAFGQAQACQFACHFDAGNNDFYGLARKARLQLRLDVMQQATQHVIATIQASAFAAQFQVGVYTFNDALVTVSATGSDLTAASAAAGAVAVPVTSNTPDTNIPAALAKLAALLPAAGDGSTASQARRYVFIVSDGVADYMNGGSRVLAPINPASCAALKAKGIKVLTLYTQYIPIPTNGFYNSNVAPFIGQVAPNMQACASSATFALSASDPASIDAAMQTMLQLALSSPARITQ